MGTDKHETTLAELGDVGQKIMQFSAQNAPDDVSIVILVCSRGYAQLVSNAPNKRLLLINALLELELDREEKQCAT